jgi:hypothetical protein
LQEALFASTSDLQPAASSLRIPGKYPAAATPLSHPSPVQPTHSTPLANGVLPQAITPADSASIEASSTELTDSIDFTGLWQKYISLFTDSETTYIQCSA